MSGFLSTGQTLGYDRFPKYDGHGTIPTAEAEYDDVNDMLAAKLRQFWRARNNARGWTREVERLRSEAEKICQLNGYKGIWVDTRDYLVHRVGQSFLFNVPVGKRGNLAEFAGQRIRIVCTYSSTHHRFIRVGAVGPVPARAKTEDLAAASTTSKKTYLLPMLREQELVHTPHLLALFRGSWNGAGGMVQAFNWGLCVQAAVLYARRTKELTGKWPNGEHCVVFRYGPTDEFDVRTPIGLGSGKREIEVYFEVRPDGKAVTSGRDHVDFNWCAFALDKISYVTTKASL